MKQQILGLSVMNEAEPPSNGKPIYMNDAMPAFTPVEGVTTDTARRLALFYELPEQFEAETRLDELLQTMLEDLVAVIPEATHGALLLRDCEHDELFIEGFMLYSLRLTQEHKGSPLQGMRITVTFLDDLHLL